jgi:predicted DNA-binding transcriptional regulator YafY
MALAAATIPVNNRQVDPGERLVRASRLLSMLMLLQVRGRVTAQELSRELEVSIRTVYRDIDSLSAAGVPIYSERGPAGGYQLMDGYRTKVTGLTPAEAGSLFLAGAPGSAAELGLGEVLAAAQLKLLASLPADLRQQAERIGARFHLDTPGWFQESEKPAFLADVAAAVWEERPLRIRYQRWQGEVTRQVDPVGLVRKGNAWYMVARADKQLRTYRLIRILELETLDEHFTRPADFDLADYWAEAQASFQERVHTGEAIIRLSPTALEHLRDTVDAYAREKVQETASLPDAEGWITATLPIESIGVARWELLRFGGEAEVLEPAELRAALADKATKMLARYGRTS